MTRKSPIANTGALEFAPAIMRIEHEGASPMPRAVLYVALALFGVMLVWAIFGRLDIIAVAQGKLIPSTYVKIVQPAEAGVLRDRFQGDVGDGLVLKSVTHAI